MSAREELLDDIKSAVNQGLITKSDIDKLFRSKTPSQSSTVEPERSSKKPSVVNGLFYAAGVILFVAVFSVITTNNFDETMSITLMAPIAFIVWMMAYLVGRSRQESDTARGIADALLLTGSLLAIASGNALISLLVGSGGSSGGFGLIEAMPVLLALSALHAGLYVFMRRDLLYLISIFLGVSSMAVLVFEVLMETRVSSTVWAATFIMLVSLLSWVTHVVSRNIKAANHLQGAFDKLAIIVSLVAMYVASFGDWAGFWYFALITAVVGIFYLSIRSKQKLLLGTASTFLVLVTVTVAFRYFSAFGVTTSLVIAATGTLAAAALTLRLHKKYLA